MRRTLSQAIKIVFSPEAILPFLIGSVFLSVFGNAVYDIFKNYFGTGTYSLIKISIISLGILALAILSVYWVIILRLKYLPIEIPFEVQQKALDRQYRGLILLVSNPDPCQTAILFHRPTLQRCWLICSRSSIEIAKELQSQFRECVDPIIVNDVYNPLEFRDAINSIYETRLPSTLKDLDVIADYTGMTAHASVGTVLSCIEKNRPLEYTPAKLDVNGRIVGSLNPIKVVLDFDSFGNVNNFNQKTLSGDNKFVYFINKIFKL